MMLINYTRDREEIRKMGGLPPGDLTTHLVCGDDTEVSFNNGVLTMKGSDIDYRIEAVNHFSTTIVNYK